MAKTNHQSKGRQPAGEVICISDHRYHFSNVQKLHDTILDTQEKIWAKDMRRQFTEKGTQDCKVYSALFIIKGKLKLNSDATTHLSD